MAQAVLLLLRCHDQTSIWSGWKKDLPDGRWPKGSAVVRAQEFDPGIAAEADIILFVGRDLRDAVVVLSRISRIKADFPAANMLVRGLVPWEREADLFINYETIFTDPKNVLVKLSKALGIVPIEPDSLLAVLGKSLAASIEAQPLLHLSFGTFRTGLDRDVVASIETHFGRWLVKHGYECETCSNALAGIAAEEVLVARIRMLAKLRELAATASSADGADEALSCGFKWFGLEKYQSMARGVAKFLVAKSGFLTEPRKGVHPNTRRTSYPPVRAQADHPCETVRRLGALVSGKTVGFLLHGSSVQNFREREGDLTGEDVVWMGINHFSLLERTMLQPYGREMSAVFCCADGEVARRLDDLTQFLHRGGDRLLITRPDHLSTFAQQLAFARDRIALEELPPLWPYPNSLALCLRLLVQSGPRRVILFGADGYLGTDDAALPSYFGSEDFIREKRSSGVLLDTLLFNAHMPRILKSWRRRLGGAFPEIINCSPGSVLAGIKRVDYSQAKAALAGDPVTPLPKADTFAPEPNAVTTPHNVDQALVACVNAARSGNLARARVHALEAILLDPSALSPFVYRVIHTDRTSMKAALLALGLIGADRVNSPDHWRWVELGQALDTAEMAMPTDEWESWE